MFKTFLDLNFVLYLSQFIPHSDFNLVLYLVSSIDF